MQSERVRVYHSLQGQAGAVGGGGLSEQELAAAVIEWLKDRGWDVYQEVESAWGVADIVARMGAITWVIECKKSFTFHVMEQAARYRYHCEMISIAVPQVSRKSRDDRTYAKYLCSKENMGVIEVQLEPWLSIKESLRSPLMRPKDNSLAHWHVRNFLREEQKDWRAAGSPNGGQWTEFKATCNRARRHVKIHPGCTIKELVNAIDHHYASEVGARSALAKWIPRGIVPGIEARRNGRQWRLYPSQESEAAKCA